MPASAAWRFRHLSFLCVFACFCGGCRKYEGENFMICEMIINFVVAQAHGVTCMAPRLTVLSSNYNIYCNG